MTRRLGFGLSLLIHGSLLAGLWSWQQARVDTAVSGEVVPVQLAMFAAAPPAPAPAAVAASAPEPARASEPLVEEVAQAVTESDPPPADPPPTRSEPLPRPGKAFAAGTPLPKGCAGDCGRPVPGPKPAPRPDARMAARPVTDASHVAATPAEPATTPAAAPRTAALVQVREAYKAALLAAIERHKFYPNRARRRRIEGQAQVGFRIEADGRIGGIVLVRGCGSPVLDQAALRTLERLGRAAPLPPELGMSHWDLVVPIDFRLLGDGRTG